MTGLLGLSQKRADWLTASLPEPIGAMNGRTSGAAPVHVTRPRSGRRHAITMHDAEVEHARIGGRRPAGVFDVQPEGGPGPGVRRQWHTNVLLAVHALLGQHTPRPVEDLQPGRLAALPRSR